MFKPLRQIYLGAALLAIVALFVASKDASAAQVPDSLLPILVNKESLARSLSKPISVCVSRRDTRHPVFHGCIDWHSSVHGNWALIALNRATPSVALSEEIRSVFSDDAIRKELEKLTNEPDFEMPYGRAWFLRLAIEHMKAGLGDSSRKGGDQVLRSLISHFQRHRIDVYSKSYSSATWALVNMLDYTMQAGMIKGRADIVAQVNREVDFWKFECLYDQESGSFMAVCSNVALLASRVLHAEDFRRWAHIYLDRVGLPTPAAEYENWHHHGLNFSRAWGLWELYSATGLLEFADAYAAHILQAMKGLSRWTDNYASLGHWLPQFGVFALQPLFGVENGR